MFPTMFIAVAGLLAIVLSTSSASLFSSLSSQDDDKNKQPAIYKRRLPTTAGDVMRMIDFWNDFSLYPQMTHNNMLVDIKEAKDHYEMHVDLPGVSKENVRITISPAQHEMQISAHREGIRHEEGQEYRLLERFVGNMTRTIYLPDQADIDKVNAKFDNGVLQINVPKVLKSEEECKSRSVEIL